MNFLHFGFKKITKLNFNEPKQAFCSSIHILLKAKLTFFIWTEFILNQLGFKSMKIKYSRVLRWALWFLTRVCNPSRWKFRVTYLECFSDVYQTTSDNRQQTVEPDHFLYQHGVHALFVRGWEPSQGSIRVKVTWELADDVSRDLIDNVICGSSTTWWSSCLPMTKITQ